MSAEFPITISSWTLDDKITFEERVKAANGAEAAAKKVYAGTEEVLEKVWPELLEA